MPLWCLATSKLGAVLQMTLILLIFVPVTCYFLLNWLLCLSQDPREPPLIRPGIPLIGHLVGMIRDGSAYYGKLTFVLCCNARAQSVRD